MYHNALYCVPRCTVPVTALTQVNIFCRIEAASFEAPRLSLIVVVVAVAVAVVSSASGIPEPSALCCCCCWCWLLA
jgi:hypothetical protein